MDSLDCLADEGRHREHRNRQAARLHGDGVCCDDFVDDACAKALIRDFVEHAMADEGADAFCAIFAKEFCGRAERAGGLGHVVNNDDVATVNFADEACRLHSCGGDAALCHKADWEIEETRDGGRGFHAADVGREDRCVFNERLIFDVVVEHRRRIEVIHRNVEKSLNLLGVQVESEDAVCACGGEQVRHEFACYRDARAVFAVLARVAEERDNRRDSLRGGAAHCVDHDEQFHQVIVCGPACRLYREDVATANILLDLDEGLAVGERCDIGFAKGNAHRIANFFCERGVRVACEYFHGRVRHGLNKKFIGADAVLAENC